MSVEVATGRKRIPHPRPRRPAPNSNILGKVIRVITDTAAAQPRRTANHADRIVMLVAGKKLSRVREKIWRRQAIVLENDGVIDEGKDLAAWRKKT